MHRKTLPSLMKLQQESEHLECSVVKIWLNLMEFSFVFVFSYENSFSALFIICHCGWKSHRLVTIFC